MASARKVHELGSVMNTESDQSSENRHQVSPPAENSQHAGTTGWNEPAGLVPSWSVPPGLIVPSPRSTVDDSADDDSAVDDSAVDDSAVDDSAWPGIAAPAGWFLRVQAAPAASTIPPDPSGPSRCSSGEPRHRQHCGNPDHRCARAKSRSRDHDMADQERALNLRPRPRPRPAGGCCGRPARSGDPARPAGPPCPRPRFPRRTSRR